MNINNNDVTIYSFKPSNHINNIDDLYKLLSKEEIYRANKFYFEKDKNIM